MRQGEGVEGGLHEMTSDSERLYCLTQDTQSVVVCQLPHLELERKVDVGLTKGKVVVDQNHMFVLGWKDGVIKIYNKEDFSLTQTVIIPGVYFGGEVLLPCSYGVLIVPKSSNYIYLLSNEESGWAIKPLNTHFSSKVVSVAVKDDIMAIAFKDFIKIKTIQEQDTLFTLTPSLSAGDVQAMVLSPPFLLAVGDNAWEGVKVWNYQTGHLIRHTKFNGRTFETIATNGNQVVIKEEMGYDDEFIFVLDLAEMCNKEMEDKKLWKEVRISEEGEDCVACHVTLNKTCLVIARDRITALQVWR